MFYSQYILAKKGPLGTIWIAAHLERKLRKNQVNETNISTSVDSILFPEVPIALRLSGHLLLGVVRIYSRKVTYLYQDCNEALHKLKSAISASAATPASINLPPGAVNASLDEITLPETLEFNDADGEAPSFVAPDSSAHHVTSRDQITLEEPEQDDTTSRLDQEERFTASLHTINIIEAFPTEPELPEDVLPPMDMDSMPVEPTPSTAPSPEVDNLRTEDETVPDVEKLRSAPDVSMEDVHVFDKQDVLEPEVEPAPGATPDIRPEDNHLVEDEERLPATPSTRMDLSSPERGGTQDATPALAVAETPASAQGKRASKKRKLVFDPRATLTESYMKDMLKDSSDIRRVRRKVAHAPDEIWMFEKERLGKRLFSRPSVYGLCSKLEEMYEQAFKRQKTSPANVTFAATPPPESPKEQTGAPEPPVEQAPEAPQSPTPIQEPVAEQVPATPVATGTVESPRLQPQTPSTPSHVQTPQTPHTSLHDLETPGYDDFVPAPDATPAETSLPANIDTDSRRGTNPLGDITNTDRAVPEPDAELVQQALSINPKVDHGPPIESSILDDSTPEGSAAQSDGWSVRTRAIAQVLRAKLEKSQNGVSVSALLRGKTRKDAARMFFETLVLYSNDYISVEQAAPYEDMSIHSRPKLMKTVF